MKLKKVKQQMRSWKRNVRQWRYGRHSILDANQAHRQIHDLILEQVPTAIGKIGSVELLGLKHWRRHTNDASALATAAGKRVCYKLYKNAGVFPESQTSYADFCRTFITSLEQMDQLAPWFLTGERATLKQYAPQAQLISTGPLYLNPIGSTNPGHWTQSLRNKKILVASPFTATIEDQFSRRELIWPGEYPLLPACTLKTLRVPLAASVTPSPYPDWLTGLEALKTQMTNCDFDVALIGAGAWSLPLATHAKTLGKIGIHLGGATQLLFGIKGKRWDKNGEPEFYSDAWVRPSSDETPETANIVESGCYW
ncbi:MAG: hypothetical protein P8R37_12810 [Opitutae bacterium]|nr:hypothetical protein [Opitutae bacterium]